MSERIELGGGWSFSPVGPALWILYAPGETEHKSLYWREEEARAFAAAIRPQVNVEALRKLSDKATKGPWRHGGVAGGWDGVETEEYRTSICHLTENNPANASFIAAAANFVRSALATPAPPPQTSGSVPDEIARAIDAYGRAGTHTAATAARAHLDTLILAAVAKPNGSDLRPGLERAKEIAEAVRAEHAARNEERSVAAAVGAARARNAIERELAKLPPASPTPPAITIDDVVAMITSDERVDRAYIAFWNKGGGHDGVSAALNVAAEAVRKMGVIR